MKKLWKKPILTSLFRGKPEESVLCGCKTLSTGGPTNVNGQCDMARIGNPTICDNCSSPQAT